MFYERLYKTRSMNLFHAFFSLGGIVGSLTASLCAYLDLSPLFSFLVLVVPWTVVCLFGCRYLQEEDRQVASSETHLLVGGTFHCYHFHVQSFLFVSATKFGNKQCSLYCLLEFEWLASMMMAGFLRSFLAYRSDRHIRSS